MKIFFVFASVLSVMSAQSEVHPEFIRNIKQEYGVIFDKLSVQAREKLIAKEDIVIWLYYKNKEEFTAIQNLMTDVKVELNFDLADEVVIKKELALYLQQKIDSEAQKLFDMDGVTVDNAQDFFHISRMICNVTLETDDVCRKMIRSLHKEYRFALQELKVVDKAREKLERIHKRRKKEDLLDQLRKQIILGAFPRQDIKKESKK